ncbi:hypothetical protein F2Q70_00004154 [Brassica cretica]|uniref:Uncharacterized protein n=1 Tax=Brassica cretica TaxID=69181 RepID=A0A8S9IQF6_BRACR|nr:hypothetical protein F2Q70_00004154 [Brassica cretica]
MEVRASRSRYVASEGLTGRYVASGSKPRRVLLVFVVKSQRKLQLRRVDRLKASVRARSLRSDRAVYVLGCYVATELRGDLGRYIASELRGELGRYVVTELRGELSRYVATEPCTCSVAT